MIGSIRMKGGALALSTLTIVASSCGVLGRDITEDELLERYPSFLEDYQEELGENANLAFHRIRQERELAAGSGAAAQPVFDVLILSGGGAFGAFGAGFLQGWGAVQEEPMRRPEFDSVSGISTGAIIAPFAFIGTDKAYADIVEIYRNPGRDWAKKRGVIPYLPGNVSLYDVSKLHAKIDDSVTAQMMGEIAHASSEGRHLMVGATCIDYGILRVWNVSSLAHEMEWSAAEARFEQVLKASSAIPGAFPPVEIDGLLYVDGGATMQVVGGLDSRAWAYNTQEAPFPFATKEDPVKIRVWMIINQKLLTNPAVVQRRWTHVGARSLDVLVRASVLQSIQDSETFVQLLNQRPEIDAEFRYVAIPQNFDTGGSEGLFDSDLMRSLIELGREMGAHLDSWQTVALRPGAPFQEK